MSIKNRLEKIEKGTKKKTFLLVHDGTNGTSPDGRLLPLETAKIETMKAGFNPLLWHEEKTYS